MRARTVVWTENERGCHVVTSHKPGNGGYVKATVDGKSQLLHRWSWEKHNMRPVPEGLGVLHRCSNPPCINPEHLYAGTHKDNWRDRSELYWKRLAENPRPVRQWDNETDRLRVERFMSRVRMRDLAERIGMRTNRLSKILNQHLPMPAGFEVDFLAGLQAAKAELKAKL